MHDAQGLSAARSVDQSVAFNVGKLLIHGGLFVGGFFTGGALWIADAAFTIAHSVLSTTVSVSHSLVLEAVVAYVLAGLAKFEAALRTRLNNIE